VGGLIRQGRRVESEIEDKGRESIIRGPEVDVAGRRRRGVRMREDFLLNL
jgi:hypothetical protein